MARNHNPASVRCCLSDLYIMYMRYIVCYEVDSDNNETNWGINASFVLTYSGRCGSTGKRLQTFFSWCKDTVELSCEFTHLTSSP